MVAIRLCKVAACDSEEAEVNKEEDKNENDIYRQTGDEKTKNKNCPYCRIM